jgi:UDP-N-acetylglucosamine:LPS N-acetylglucosamine transferase
MMEWMKLSDLLVSLAGHTTCMELASLGIPSLLIPIENHPEQLKNALKMKKYGIAHVENMENLNSKNITNYINKALDDPDLKEGSANTQKIFSRYNGTENASKIISDCIAGKKN